MKRLNVTMRAPSLAGSDARIDSLRRMGSPSLAEGYARLANIGSLALLAGLAACHGSTEPFRCAPITIELTISDSGLVDSTGHVADSIRVQCKPEAR